MAGEVVLIDPFTGLSYKAGGSGGSGAQPAASSQSVTPASDGAAFPITGTVADNTADSGNSVKVSGVYSATTIVGFNPGARIPLQTDSKGSLRVVMTAAGATPVDGGTFITTPARMNGVETSPLPLPSGALAYNWTGSALVMARGDTTGTYVVTKGGGSIATAQVAVGTTAAIAAPARAGRKSVTLTSSAAFWVGPTGVTSATGYPVPAGAAITLNTAAAVYAVAAATGTVAIIEDY